MMKLSQPHSSVKDRHTFDYLALKRVPSMRFRDFVAFYRWRGKDVFSFGCRRCRRSRPAHLHLIPTIDEGSRSLSLRGTSRGEGSLPSSRYGVDRAEMKSPSSQCLTLGVND